MIVSYQSSRVKDIANLNRRDVSAYAPALKGTARRSPTLKISIFGRGLARQTQFVPKYNSLRK